MKRWSQPTALDGVNVVRYITVPNPFACRLGKSQVRLGHSISPDASLRHRKCLEGTDQFIPFNVLSLFVVCLFVPQRHEHDCSPVVHACVRVFSRGSRPTSRPTPVISRIFPFSSHNYCLSHKHMAVAVHHVFCALHPLLRVCCCLLLRIPASQLHSPPIRVRGRVGGSHRGGAIWQPPCPLWCRVGGTTHRLFISVVHWEGRVTFTVRGSARDRDE